MVYPKWLRDEIKEQVENCRRSKKLWLDSEYMLRNAYRRNRKTKEATEEYRKICFDYSCATLRRYKHYQKKLDRVLH